MKQLFARVCVDCRKDFITTSEGQCRCDKCETKNAEKIARSMVLDVPLIYRNVSTNNVLV